MKTQDAFFDFPRGAELRDILQLQDTALQDSAELDELLAKSLIDPVSHIFSRPGKNLRSALVDFAFSVASQTSTVAPEILEASTKSVKQIIEILHNGSLIIDDIQDGSTERRGAPSLHVVHGIPLALNAGNWLYFLPFQIIETMKVSDRQKVALNRELHSTLLRAHYGQALDVGVCFESVTQDRLPAVSRAAVELKTGALAALACKMAALACETEAETTTALETIGKCFGVALQMYDDVGNLVAEKNNKKWIEDIRLRKISSVVAAAAAHLSADQFQSFVRIAQTDDCEAVRTYLVQHGVAIHAKECAERVLNEAIHQFQTQIACTDSQLETLQGLQQKLKKSYE